MRLQADAACDLNQFISLVHKLLNAAWGEKWGTFCEAFPNGQDPESVNLPAITYKVKSKRPGVISKDGTREIKPRHRKDYQVPPGENDDLIDLVSVYAQWMDHDIVFEVWEETNTQLTVLAERFEDFMMTYAGYFKSKGVGEIIFDHMLNDYGARTWRDNLVSRSYSYYVRLERYVVVPTSVIKEIIGKVEIYENLSDVSSQNIESINFES
jgi:hypothetical protein